MKHKRALVMLTSAVPLVCFALFNLLSSRSALAVEWRNVYIPGGLNSGRAMNGELHSLGKDRLLEGGQLGNAAIFSVDGKQQWQFAAPNEACMGIAVDQAAGRFYIGTSKNRLHAFDFAGTHIWTIPVPGNKVWSCFPAVGADGLIYVSSSDGVLFSIDPSGAVKWRKEFTTLSGRCPPVVGPDGMVYARTSNLALIAITPDGAELWRSPNGVAGLQQAAPAAGGLVVCNREMNGLVTALRADGSQAWHFTYAANPLAGTPVVDSTGTTYVFTQQPDELVGLGADGKQRWSRPCNGLFTRLALDAKDRLWVVEAAGMPTGSMAWLKGLLPGSGLQVMVLDSHGSVLGKRGLRGMMAMADPIVCHDGSVMVYLDTGELVSLSLP